MRWVRFIRLDEVCGYGIVRRESAPAAHVDHGYKIKVHRELQSAEELEPQRGVIVVVFWRSREKRTP